MGSVTRPRGLLRRRRLMAGEYRSADDYPPRRPRGKVLPVRTAQTVARLQLCLWFILANGLGTDRPQQAGYLSSDRVAPSGDVTPRIDQGGIGRETAADGGRECLV